MVDVVMAALAFVWSSLSFEGGALQQLAGLFLPPWWGAGPMGWMLWLDWYTMI
jgi:hypothetical protein